MLITSDGFGAFHATNGYDTVYAKYERGRKALTDIALTGTSP